MLANIYLHAFDVEVQARGLGVLVRYADDFVIMCRTPERAEEAREILGSLGLELHQFNQVDDYVVRRLFRLMVKKRGRNLHAGVAGQWTEDWFNDHGLYRLRGTVRYPKAA